MGRLSGEAHQHGLEVADIIRHARGICLIENLADEVDAGLGSRAVLLEHGVADDVANMQLVLEFLVIDHRFLSFRGKP